MLSIRLCAMLSTGRSILFAGLFLSSAPSAPRWTPVPACDRCGQLSGEGDRPADSKSTLVRLVILPKLKSSPGTDKGKVMISALQNSSNHEFSFITFSGQVSGCSFRIGNFDSAKRTDLFLAMSDSVRSEGSERRSASLSCSPFSRPHRHHVVAGGRRGALGADQQRINAIGRRAGVWINGARPWTADASHPRRLTGASQAHHLPTASLVFPQARPLTGPLADK